MIQAVLYAIIGISALVLAYFLYFKKEFETPKLSVPIFEDSHRVEVTPRQNLAVSESPVMGICAACSESISMPFKCKFCNGLFCGEHRLPENHSCIGL